MALREQVLREWNNCLAKINDLKLSEEDKYALRVIKGFSLISFLITDLEQLKTEEERESWRKKWKDTAQALCERLVNFTGDNEIVMGYSFTIYQLAYLINNWISLQESFRRVWKERNKLEDQLEELKKKYGER